MRIETDERLREVLSDGNVTLSIERPGKAPLTVLFRESDRDPGPDRAPARFVNLAVKGKRSVYLGLLTGSGGGLRFRLTNGSPDVEGEAEESPEGRAIKAVEWLICSGQKKVDAALARGAVVVRVESWTPKGQVKAPEQARKVAQKVTEELATAPVAEGGARRRTRTPKEVKS